MARYCIDAETLLHIVRSTATPHASHQLLAPSSIRSDALTLLLADVAAGRIAPEAVDENAITARLDTAGIPDPDLVIRTSGETRISNFLLWQSAYAEYEFTQTLWPDFSPAELETILNRFRMRDRRYGGTVRA